MFSPMIGKFHHQWVPWMEVKKKMRLPWRFALPNMKFSWKISPTSEKMTFKKKHTHTKNWMVFMVLASKKTSLKPSHWTVAPPVPRDLPCQRFVFDKFSRSHFDAGFFLPENLTYFLVNFEIHQLKRQTKTLESTYIVHLVQPCFAKNLPKCSYG